MSGSGPYAARSIQRRGRILRPGLRRNPAPREHEHEQGFEPEERAEEKAAEDRQGKEGGKAREGRSQAVRAGVTGQSRRIHIGKVVLAHKSQLGDSVTSHLRAAVRILSIIEVREPHSRSAMSAVPAGRKRTNS